MKESQQCQFSNIANASVKAGRRLAPCNRSGPDLCVLVGQSGTRRVCLFVKNLFLMNKKKDGSERLK